MDFEWIDPRHTAMETLLRKLSKEKGYKMDTIGHLCPSFNGKTANQYVTSGVPIIKLRNITNDGINWDTDFVLKTFYDENPKTHTKIDDLLITSTGEGTIGRVAIMDKSIDCMCAVDISILRVEPSKIQPLYLLHYLRSFLGQMQFERYTVGSTGQTHLKNLGKFLIVYPELISEQMEKARISETYMEMARQQKSVYHEEIQKARINFFSDQESLQPSQFFQHHLSNADVRWNMDYLDPRHKVMDKIVLSFVADGKFESNVLANRTDPLCEISRGKTADLYVSTGVPILKVRNITGNGINWKTHFVLKTFYDENPKCHLRKDDVLLTSTGEGTIGRVDIFVDDFPCIADGHVTIIRVKRCQKILPAYLAYFLRSRFSQMQFERYTVGSTGQTELNREDIKKVVVVYPKSLESQKELAESAFNHQQKAIQAKTEYRKYVELAKEEFVKSIGL